MGERSYRPFDFAQGERSLDHLTHCPFALSVVEAPARSDTHD